MGRTRVEIKDEIVDELENYPKTTHGVATAINSHYDTAKKNLEELQDDGIVIQEGDEEKWRLNK
jgi:predicted transcriptional regulator